MIGDGRRREEVFRAAVLEALKNLGEEPAAQPAETLKPKAIEEAAMEWRGWLRDRMVAHGVFTLVSVLIATISTSFYKSERENGLEGWPYIQESVSAFDMPAVSTLTITATAVIASVTIAVVVAPPASLAESLNDLVAAAMWAEVVSIAALLLSSVTSGIVITTLFRSPTESGGTGWHLVPLIGMNALLVVMTTARAHNNSVAASPQRRLLRLTGRIATFRALGVPKTRIHEIRWMRIGLWATLGVSAIVSSIVVWLFPGYPAWRIFAIAFANALMLTFIVFVPIAMFEAMRLALVARRHWRAAGTCWVAAVLSGWVTIAIAIWAPAEDVTYGLLVSIPALTATLSYVASFHLGGFRFSHAGGWSPAWHRATEGERARATTKVASL